MYLVLHGSEKNDFPHIFNTMFLLRYNVFIKERGWALPSSKNIEIDEYDVDEAVYFFGFDSDEPLHSFLRLSPTETRSLTADYFPHLIETGEAPRASDMYEATRLIVKPLDKTQTRQLRFNLIYVMTKWCIEHRISKIQAVIDKSMLGTYIELNPMTVPLGLAQTYAGGLAAPGGGECMVIRFPTNLETLKFLDEHSQLYNKTPIPKDIHFLDSKSVSAAQ